MLTKLDAVNEMLAAIGEDPVASLESGLDDAEAAEDTLDRWSKKIQARGWHCNTEEYTATLDINGEVPLADTVLRVDTIEKSKHINVTARYDGTQRKLWNVKDRTFEFTTAPKVQTVNFLDFDNLTYELQVYITARATQAYQADNMGSVALDNFRERDEMEAWANLMDAEGESEDLNMIRSNRFGFEATYRHNPRGVFF